MALRLVNDWRIHLPRFVNQSSTVALHPLPPGIEPEKSPLEKDVVATSRIRGEASDASSVGRRTLRWTDLRTYLLLVGTMALLLLKWLGLVASGAVAAGHLFPDCASGPLAKNAVCNTSVAVEVRAKALVAELTTAEKFPLVVNTSPGVPRLGLPSYQWWREFSKSGILHHSNIMMLKPHSLRGSIAWRRRLSRRDCRSVGRLLPRHVLSGPDPDGSGLR